jgi:hypothetical protein
MECSYVVNQLCIHFQNNVISVPDARKSKGDYPLLRLLHIIILFYIISDHPLNSFLRNLILRCHLEVGSFS